MDHILKKFKSYRQNLWEQTKHPLIMPLVIMVLLGVACFLIYTKDFVFSLLYSL